MTYDTSGNLLTDNGAAGNKTYDYNKRNRLAQATVGALAYNYSYNALEQLAIRTQASPATTTHFIHGRLGNVIAETAGGGPTGATGTTREYIWLYETEIAPTIGSRTVVDRPLAVVNNVNAVSPATPVTYWVSVDHLNRPILMTNASKTSLWAAVWQPWGGAHSITGTLDARLPGQWYQSETGLHYNWHRSYDPTVGRYTQPDPLGFVDGPSVYGYAGGSPQSAVDRDGRFRVTPNSPLPPTLGRPYTPRPPYPTPYPWPVPDLNFDLYVPPANNLPPSADNDRDHYHNVCDAHPPPGLSACQQALWNLSRHKAYLALRKKWKDDYGPRKHDQQLPEVETRIENAEAKVREVCGPGGVLDYIKYCPR
jgi:RHS repeat-associated protein